MQKVIVQIDWYTKVILTLIAVLLAGILAKPYIVSRPAGASRSGEDVVVTNDWRNPVAVEIMNLGIEVANDLTNPVPVLIVTPEETFKALTR